MTCVSLYYFKPQKHMDHNDNRFKQQKFVRKQNIKDVLRLRMTYLGHFLL